MLLDGKVAVVTGASSARGIGKATAELFAEHGARVALLDIDQKATVEAAASVGSEHFGAACDVRIFGECQRAVDEVLRKFGRLDILVNNAGVTQGIKTLDLTDQDYDFVMDVNLRGGLHMGQAVLPTMKAQGSGSIVFISSVTGQRGGGIFGGPHYAASKAGVIGLAKSMAREFGPAGIRVNTVSPGVIDTDISRGRRTPEERLLNVKGSPIERLGTAAEVAGACLFLASDLASYITGTVIDVNGGLHMH